MVFHIKLAEQVIEVHSLCHMVYTVCEKYTIPFDENIIPNISVRIKDEDILQELHIIRMLYKYSNGNSSVSVGEAICESLAVFHKIADAMPDFNTFLMHGSVVACDGQAYMFVAPSGVGKSTRTKIWVDEIPGSLVVNGDKPLIKVKENEVLACGTPWCGKEGWNTNVMIPLRAIFLLERADDSQNNMIREIDFEDAFPNLLKQTHRSEKSELALKTVCLLSELQSKVKIYRFRSAPTSEAIHLAYETARPH